MKPQIAQGPAAFAPDERASPVALSAQVEALIGNELASTLLDAYPTPAMILNTHRQIVRANMRLVNLCGDAEASLWGLRPGEAFGCVRAEEEPGGCGTAKACRFCGALQAVLRVEQHGEQVTEDCRLRRRRGDLEEAFELRATVSPLPIDDERYLLVAFEDITDVRRREVFERLFFDETVSLLHGLLGLLNLLDEGADDASLRAELRLVAGRLTDEIQAQRELNDAERGDLRVQIQPVVVQQVLDAVKEAHLLQCEEAGVAIDVDSGDLEVIESDPQLLRRVLWHLTENAIEASERGHVVTVRARTDRFGAAFEVHNDGAMPQDVQAQLFQRSFSTKSVKGRGLGTYTVKLLTERYLGGEVSFTSTAEDGTTVRISLPQC
jgi:signal transduction histidine kinase